MKPFAAFVNHLTGSSAGTKPAASTPTTGASGGGFAAKLNGSGAGSSNPNAEANKQVEDGAKKDPNQLTGEEKELADLTALRTMLIMKNMGSMPNRVQIQDYDE